MEFTTIAEAKRLTGLSYLGSVNKSAKLAKNGKINHQYTYGIYFAPASQSGFNACSHSTPECRLGCLATSGRAGIELIAGKTMTMNARVKKTKLFFEQTAFFMQWLIAEIKLYQAKAKKDGYGFSVRLNCTSDIDWQKVYVNGQNIFQIFSDTQFYDYTKSFLKFKNLPKNYHLTYSYTGYNWKFAKQLLEQGFNVAVVFNVNNENQLPKTFNGFDVINADLSDYRVLDGKGIICGLKWKHIANKEAEKQILNSVFVVQPDNIECNVHELELEMV